MTMTVAALHKRLGALIEAGHGRKPVLVDRATFSDPRDNDGLILMSPWAVQGPRWIANADDDGGTKWNKDGTESGQRCVLIVGDGAEPEAPAAGVPTAYATGGIVHGGGLVGERPSEETAPPWPLPHGVLGNGHQSFDDQTPTRKETP